MIALDPLEQMHSQPFELIGADTRGHGFPGLIKIKPDFISAEQSHRHPRHRDRLKRDLAIERNRNGGMQFVGLTRERPKLIGCGNATIGLIEQPVCQGQRLVGANDIMSGIARRYPSRLFPCQQFRDLAGLRKF